MWMKIAEERFFYKPPKEQAPSRDPMRLISQIRWTAIGHNSGEHV